MSSGPSHATRLGNSNGDSAPAAGSMPAEGLDLVYRSCGRAIAARLARVPDPAEDGLDLVHDAVARVLERPVARSPVANIEAFIGQVARNLFRDSARKRSTRDAFAEQSRQADCAHADPVVYLETRDTLRRLEKALGRLDPVTRDVFVARRVDGLSYAEISGRTGLSAKAVEKRMAKAIAKLSRLMDRC